MSQGGSLVGVRSDHMRWLQVEYQQTILAILSESILGNERVTAEVEA